MSHLTSLSHHCKCGHSAAPATAVIGDCNLHPAGRLEIVHIVCYICALPRIAEVPSLMCTLFGSLVRPILSYGCAVWTCLPNPGAAANCKRCEVLHRGFLKRCAGVATAAPDDIVYWECGHPQFLQEMTARYLQHLEAAGGLSCAYQESLSLHNAGHTCWIGWAQQQGAAVQPWEAGWLQRLRSSQTGSKHSAYNASKPTRA